MGWGISALWLRKRGYRQLENDRKDRLSLARFTMTREDNWPATLDLLVSQRQLSLTAGERLVISIRAPLVHPLTRSSISEYPMPSFVKDSKSEAEDEEELGLIQTK